MRKTTIIRTIQMCIGLLTLISARGQQDPNRAFYRYTMNLVNPAYAGAEGGVEGSAVRPGAELGVNLRSQWANVEGAPESQSVLFATPMGKNVGLGVSVINDQTFIENSTSINLDVSYKVQLSELTALYFGIKAGMSSYDANLSGLETFGIGADPSLRNINGSFKPNIGSGALLQGGRYFVSLSVPQLLSNDRLEQEDGRATYAAGKPHVYLAGGYDFALSSRVKFKPSTIFRYIATVPLSVDVTAAFSFNDRLELGPSYRFQEGFGGLFIFNAVNWLDIGYAYEAAFNNEISTQSQGTHEVFMRLRP